MWFLRYVLLVNICIFSVLLSFDVSSFYIFCIFFPFFFFFFFSNEEKTQFSSPPKQKKKMGESKLDFKIRRVYVNAYLWQKRKEKTKFRLLKKRMIS